MIIIFLTGSLEPGCDGVGDYTRRLAGELVRQGHKIGIIAINDTFIRKVCFKEQYIENICMPVLRIPAKAEANEKEELAKSWIESFNPEWLSLQFVPFSFNNKGLPFTLVKWLTKIGKGRNWHFMFHELWVGAAKDSSYKSKLWGTVQKFLIKTLLLVLKPKIIHTQTQMYKSLLSKLGFDAKILPLFSNIKPNQNNGKEFIGILEGLPKNISFVLFGSIHPNLLVHHFVKEVSVFAINNSFKISLKIVGRSGGEKQIWINEFKKYGLEVEELGEQSENRVSELLSSSTIGISTTPLALIEKSGTVASFAAHGLPILCVANEWIEKDGLVGDEIPGVTQYVKGQLEKYLLGKPVIPKTYSVFDTAIELLASFSE